MVSLSKNILFIFIVILSRLNAIAQNYHAIQGSSYAGSLGLGNNPSSIVNTPFAWDINVFSMQAKYTTNAVTFYKYSLLTGAANSEYAINNGNFSRYGKYNFNAHILNARFALSRTQAIAFGLNVRGYGNIQTSPYHFLDTVKTLTHFLKINQSTNNYDLKFLSSTWVEIFGTYSRTIWDHETSRLNAGITVKAMRGISGAFANIDNTSVEAQPASIPPGYNLVNGNVSYGYSSNYDGWNNKFKTSENLKNFLTHSEGGVSIDLGVEYLIKYEAVQTFNDDESYYDYEWKIGLSLLDLGQNKYKYGTRSRSLSNVIPGITDKYLSTRFNKIKSFDGFNDSAAAIVSNVVQLAGVFEVINPARLVINADRYLFDAFYVNGDVSINLSQLAGSKKLHVSEFNMITITPRWETRRWGVYLPMQYNTRNNFWVGGAFKAGPLLIGIHNWGNLFSQKKMQRGGGYLAIVIHPGSNSNFLRDKRLDCP